MSKDNEELRKLIAENPELPLVFYVNNDDLCYDYYSTVFEGCRCRLGEVYMDEEITYEGLDDIVDEYRDKLCDEDGYRDLPDDEYDKAVEKYVNENIRHYKAIIVIVN